MKQNKLVFGLAAAILAMGTWNLAQAADGSYNNDYGSSRYKTDQRDHPPANAKQNRGDYWERELGRSNSGGPANYNRGAYPPPPPPYYGDRNYSRSGNRMPWDSNRGGSRMPWENRRGGSSMPWDSKRGGFMSKDKFADAWDDMLNKPSDMGEMPGGWTAPSVSMPNPVDVGDEFGDAARDAPEQMRNVYDDNRRSNDRSYDRYR